MSSPFLAVALVALLVAQAVQQEVELVLACQICRREIQLHKQCNWKCNCIGHGVRHGSCIQLHTPPLRGRGVCDNRSATAVDRAPNASATGM